MGHSDHQHQGIPLGTTEMFGEEMDQRKHVIGIIGSVYRKFGFDLLKTPTLEYAKIFKGHHGEGEELLFRLNGSSSEKLVLRYDLTVPLARYVSDHPEVPVPFKRYQIATVFRNDEVDKGHFREFTQCDADVVGISDLTADAEVICMAYTGLEKLGFSHFRININHRKIINALSEKSSLSNREGRLAVQRALDVVSKFSEKWEYHGNPQYRSSFAGHIHEILVERNLSEQAIDVIQSALTIDGDFDKKMIDLRVLLKDFPEGLIGISELMEITSYLPSRVKQKIDLDLSLARGADYYTGFILEGSIPNISVGAILGGGRFDNLVKDLGGPNLPAVGMAFGLERIMVSLAELNILKNIKSATRIIVVPKNEEEKAKLFDFARKLRGKGINTDFVPMFSHTDDEISTYALKRGFTALAINNHSSIQIHQIGRADLIDLSLLID